MKSPKEILDEIDRLTALRQKAVSGGLAEMVYNAKIAALEWVLEEKP